MSESQHAHDQTDPGLGAPDDMATRALKIRPAQPVPATDTTQRLALEPPLPEARPEPAAPKASNLKYWIIGSLAVVLLAGTLGYYFWNPSAENPVAAKPEEEAPPILRPYLDRAAQGDASAMRMLGTMYYNGLNVRQDRKEGAKWYRKAAAAGSVGAKKDLETLGLTAEDR
jgi:TPR repeat protein